MWQVWQYLQSGSGFLLLKFLSASVARDILFTLVLHSIFSNCMKSVASCLPTSSDILIEWASFKPARREISNPSFTGVLGGCSSSFPNSYESDYAQAREDSTNKSKFPGFSASWKFSCASSFFRSSWRRLAASLMWKLL